MSKFVDAKLMKWSELSDLSWGDLLLGNGFSINIHNGFRYDKLKDVACLDVVDVPLSLASKSLFKKYDTANFEDILRAIYHALNVNSCLELGVGEELVRCYNNVRNALASAVNYSHVPEGMSVADLIKSRFGGFKRIFTTNYDLIPYWSINSPGAGNFKDFMWGDKFNASEAKIIWGSPTCIYFLHGGLHLVEDQNGFTMKRKSQGFGSLRELFNLSSSEWFPLMITEGHWQKKLAKIKRNEYLSFCFSAFSESNNSLLVLGHSLHADYDKHIVDAVAQSPRQHIAISVWPGLEEDEIISFKARINESVSGYTKFIYYFDSTTHPLTSSDMVNVPLVM